MGADVSSLYSSNSSTTSDRNTALLLAIKGNHDAAVDALLDAGGPHEIDHQNVKGVTALALAAQKGRLNHLVRLIDCGGQVRSYPVFLSPHVCRNRESPLVCL